MEATRRFDFEGLVLSLEHRAPVTVLATAEAGVVPFVLASLRHRVDRPLVVVVPDEARLQHVVEGLQAFEGEQWPGLAPVVTFEAADVSPYREVAPPRALAQRRVAAGYRLNLGLGVAAVVCTAEALMTRTLGPRLLDRATALASTGSNLDLVELVEILSAAGYERVPVVEDPGSFALRGDGIDVWSPLYDRPVRIDMRGDDVAAMRQFDPETQTGDEAGGHLLDLVLTPARELRLEPSELPEAEARLTDLADQLDVGNVELQALLSEVRQGHVVPGMEALLPGLVAERATLLELAPTDGRGAPVVVLDNPDACLQALDVAWTAARQAHDEARAAGRLVYPPEVLLAPPDDIRRQLGAHVRLLVRPFALLEEGRQVPTFQLDVGSNREVAQALKDARGRDEGLRPLVARIRMARKLQQLVVIAAHSEGGRQRMQQILRHYGVGSELHEGPLRPADIAGLRQRRDLDTLLVLGGSGEGYHIEALHLLVVDEDEIFGHKTVRPERLRKKRTGHAFIRDIAELREGDYVVHVDHGIGRYVGLQRMEVAGVAQDFLLLLYKDDQRLYVPVTSLERVQKYVSGEVEGGSEAPQLDRLGHDRWLKAKRRAKKAVAEVAVELVRLYAERQARPGHAFSPPDEVYREWEAAFPWEETPDQQRAIDEVLADLCVARPTDRLVCGDVGYGKTEVAIRAAVKVALDGKQVAVLVPTTVLAEQHRLTFVERCRGLPLAIGGLSRFRTPAEQKETLVQLAAGELDIVVGTHRLLSKDVQFKDLGLLVIDEEHRFGVTHKEAIKKWKSSVDCLTLSATPIPRTLQLATLGLRDLSLISTPPENRKSVRTVVCRGADDVLTEALELELGRAGQAFYVCNRISRLPEIAEQLQALVPGVKPVIAHGQMPEQELEDAMLRFVRRDANVLVTTTIIESGLDIPNANTMFIERADTFGLAQLYQLRGRVGRSGVRAYCYLMVPERERMTIDGARRVAVLERFSELGSGVQIASHDMEIRGAGNILGDEQSGHIAEIGYDLYVKLLEEAVAELRGEELGAPVDPEIKLPVTAYLPDTYIPDANQRLGAYKRLAGVRTDEDLEAAVRQLADRYGHLPPVAHALVETLEVRVLALALGLHKVEQGPAAIALTLHEKGRLQPEVLLPLVNARGTPWRLTPDMVLSKALTKAEQEDPLATCKAVLRQLLRAIERPAEVTIDVEPEGPPQLPAFKNQEGPPRKTGRLRIVGR
jgi:transcription-repair coupling factor (superfamily II helicase)